MDTTVQFPPMNELGGQMVILVQSCNFDRQMRQKTESKGVENSGKKAIKILHWVA